MTLDPNSLEGLDLKPYELRFQRPEFLLGQHGVKQD